MRYKLSRRSVLAGAGVVAAATTAEVLWRPERRFRRPAAPVGGVRPYSMAMHVHASFSEGPGSMEAQLTQAVEQGVDVLWWTEHDQRMAAHAYREFVHFDGPVELENDLVWKWVPQTIGAAGAVTHRFVTDVYSPRDAAKPGSLLLGVSSDGDRAVHQLQGVAEQSLLRTSLDGHTIQLDLRPTSVSTTSFIGVDVVTSYRPARNGRPAGNYVLSYRVGGSYPAGTLVTKDEKGIITLDAPVGEWTTVTLRPARDLSALWPGVDGRDAALFEFHLVASALTGGTAAGYFDRLRFVRARNDGQLPLQTQGELARAYEEQFPTVRQIQALELSLTTPHLGWYGGRLALPDHRGEQAGASLDPARAAAAVKLVQSRGGVASYNHMFGTGTGGLTALQQEKARQLKAAELVVNQALGCDLLEVGYRLRGGCTLDQHVSVWDSCSRNAVFLTGTGVSDDHKGKDWAGLELNFVTWAWARSSDTDDLVDALRRGRAYFGDPRHFRGRIDLTVDGTVPMGSVGVSDRDSRELWLEVAGIPPGGSVDVLRGDVDHAGPDQVDPVLSTTTLRAGDFDAADVATVTVDCSVSRFVRLVVKTADGVPVGFSNPIWLLRERPPRGIPKARRT